MNQDELDVIVKNTKFLNPSSIFLKNAKTAIKEIEFNLDNRKKYVYVSDVVIIKCPYCNRWSIIYKNKVPHSYIKDFRSFNKYSPILITAHLRASPRHAHRIYKFDENTMHSDGNYAGWAGDHYEFVWGFYPPETKSILKVGLSEDLINASRCHSSCSRREESRRTLIVNSDSLPLDSVVSSCDIVLSPHYACLIKSALSNADLIKEIGNLKIYKCDCEYAVYNNDYNVPIASHIIKYDSEYLQWWRDIYRYTIMNTDYIFFESKIPFTIASLHHSIADLPAGKYLFAHEILDYD